MLLLFHPFLLDQSDSYHSAAHETVLLPENEEVIQEKLKYKYHTLG